MKIELTASQLKYIENTPTLHKELIRKAMLGKLSPRQAIKAKCLGCVGFEDSTDRIRNCTSKTCELLSHRPYQIKSNEPVSEKSRRLSERMRELRARQLQNKSTT